jgi:hypothetical protein
MALSESSANSEVGRTMATSKHRILETSRFPTARAPETGVDCVIVARSICPVKLSALASIPAGPNFQPKFFRQNDIASNPSDSLHKNGVASG